MESDNRKSVYRYGAEYGRYMGMYLIALSACFIGSSRLPVLSLVMAVMLIAFPVIIYFQLRNIYRESPHNRTFSALWTAGIMSTLCGCLICALATAAWLIYVQPNFFADYIRSAIQTIQLSDMRAEYQAETEMLQQALESGASPSPMQFVLSMVWSTVFLGSIISMVCSWVLIMRSRRSMSRMC